MGYGTIGYGTGVVEVLEINKEKSQKKTGRKEDCSKIYSGFK